MFYFWYCFDDYVARLANNPELGTVPWWVPLVLSLIVSPFFVRRADK